MSVSAGTGGTTLVGVVVGGAATQSDAPTSVVGSLPFTGASDVMVLVAIALVLLLAGILAVGLARRRPADGDLL
jgi:LPXTG-motif cell wall-anchored protein